jgi:hypothetical protein
MKRSVTFLNGLKAVLLSALLVTTLFACKKEVKELSEERSDESDLLSATEVIRTSTNPNLVYEETFEGPVTRSTVRSKVRSMDIGEWDHALQFVPNDNYPGPVFQGEKAARFEMKITDPQINSGLRSEITPVRGVDGDITKNSWYSFAIYLPTDGFAFHEERDCLFQFKALGSPASTFRTRRDRYLIESGNSPANRKHIDLGPILKDTWTEFVFHYIHSYESDGLIEVWRNGVKVLTTTGGNMYEGPSPRWKIGLYTTTWNQVTNRVVYYDNIRVGNENATFADMTSGVALPPPPPPIYPQQVVSYTLVNASKDMDIMDITDGSVISLAAIGTSKLNIRVNTDPVHPEGGCVSINLGGNVVKSTIDDMAPFTLSGDNGAGNYYTWSAIPGSYTLQATPYAGKKSSLGHNTGLERSINFTLTE